MNSPPPRGQGCLPRGTGGAGISDQAPRGIGTCQARKCRLKGTAGWGRAQPPSHRNNPFWQELALTTAGCISKEARMGKTEDNMVTHILRAGERWALWSRDVNWFLSWSAGCSDSGRHLWIPRSKHLCVRCSRGTPSRTWAEPQTHTPAPGERRPSGGGLPWPAGSAQAQTNPPLCGTRSEKTALLP